MASNPTASSSFVFDTARDGKPHKKAKLLDDSSSDDEDDNDQDGGAATASPGELKINEQYARRFEHNKKREERQRLEEKYKSSEKKPKKADDGNEETDSESSSSSEDETEDEDGFLATEDLDAQISGVLSAIKNKDPRVRDKDFSFFQAQATPGDNDGADSAIPSRKKEKPLYLKDYQRERILAGEAGASSDEEDEDAGNKRPQTYAQEQAALKNAIVSEINKATAADSEGQEGSGDDDDDDFVKRKEKKKKKSSKKEDVDAASNNKTVTEADIASANKNPELYLSNFMASRAWIEHDDDDRTRQHSDGRNWRAFESDDDDNSDAADEFEHAYNMRFEDPQHSNEVLRTYARDVTNARSVRREETTGRKRHRQLETERRDAEKAERRDEKARLRRLRLEEAEEKLRKMKQVAGMSGRDSSKMTDEDWVKFLNADWDDENWEKEMQRRFGEEYYAQEEREGVTEEIEDEDGDDDDEDDGKSKNRGKKGKKPKKPTWDDDIDITDIVPDFEADEDKPDLNLSGDEGAAAAQEDEDDDEEDGGGPSKKRKMSTKDHKNNRQVAKKAARIERSKLEALVDARMDLDPDVVLGSGAGAGPSSGTKHQHRQAAAESAGVRFRYRETSPQAFGMTARDILLAPNDSSLNKYAGLKKLATFRDEEKKRKDRKSLGKKARLREWRRETFGRRFERTGPEWEGEREGLEIRGQQQQQQLGEDGGAAVANGDRGEGGEASEKKKKKRKRSRGTKGNNGAAVEA